MSVIGIFAVFWGGVMITHLNPSKSAIAKPHRH